MNGKPISKEREAEIRREARPEIHKQMICDLLDALDDARHVNERLAARVKSDTELIREATLRATAAEEELERLKKK